MSGSSILPGNQPEAASERMAVRRRDLIQGVVIGAAAVAAGSTIGERVEAAEPVFAENALDQALATKLSQLPADYDPLYVKNVIVPALRSRTYIAERPARPMIDVMFSKEMLPSSPIGGLLYQAWQPNQEVEGVTVFIRDIEKRGPDNLRKKIFVSAVTPDLYAPVYSKKVKDFLDRLFDNSNAGQPLMARYNDNFFDFYWDLHLGVKGSDIPKEVRDFCASFVGVLAYGDFTQRVVYENYMNARRLRPTLNDWVDARVRDIASGKVTNAQQTMAWYWIKNGELGENFRERDVVFECMHDLIALGQFGVALYTFMEKLEEDQGDLAVRALFKKTMESDYDQAGGAAFTPLDRLVMEVFRTSNVNVGSSSSMKDGSSPPQVGSIRTPHLATSLDPRHWEKPEEFNPERYLSVPTSHKADASECQTSGLARCPFESVPFRVKDGRNAEITNSAFGAVYGEVDGKPLPLCDYAGYAPFGFGYRRCAGELLTVEFFKDLLRKVWKEKIVFQRLKSLTPEKIPVSLVLLTDDIGFSRKS